MGNPGLRAATARGSASCCGRAQQLDSAEPAASPDVPAPDFRRTQIPAWVVTPSSWHQLCRRQPAVEPAAVGRSRGFESKTRLSQGHTVPEVSAQG